MPRTLVFDPSRSDLQPARLYQLTCADGTIVRLTDADHDVTLGDATTWSVLPGVSFADLTFSDEARGNNTQLTVPLEVGSPFDPTAVRRGKFRSAAWSVRLVDLSDVSTSGFLAGGIVADQTWSEDLRSITFELRSDISLAKTILVEGYGSLCRAQLGDYINPSNPGRCKLPFKPDDILRSQTYAVGDWVRVQTGSGPTGYANRIYRCTAAGATASVQPAFDAVVGHSTIDGAATFIAVEAWMRTVVVATIVSPYEFTITDPLDARAVDGYFALGAFAVNGDYGRAYDVRAYVSATRTVKLWLPRTEILTVGDVIDIMPGCDRRRKPTCITTFNNAVNFRGED